MEVKTMTQYFLTFFYIQQETFMLLKKTFITKNFTISARFFLFRKIDLVTLYLF